MKSYLPFVLVGLIITPALFAKARLGEYYLGFGYSMADGGNSADDLEGDFLNFRASNPFDSSSDLGIYLEYGNLERTGSDASSWNLGVDYITHFEGPDLGSSNLRPYLGLGLGFLDEETPTRLGEDGFTWSVLLGTELKINKFFSLHLGGRFYGLWSEFGQNEFTTDLGCTWWFNPIHGASFQYQHAVESELNYFTLEYLYSWQ